MVRSVWAFAAASATVLASLVGCAHEAAEERQLADLSRAIEKDQSFVDRSEPRINERESLAKAPALSDSAPVPGGGARREAAPGDGAEGAGALDGDDPNDTTPRPVIRIVGGGRTGRRGGSSGIDRIDETLPDEPSNGGAAGPPIRTNAPPSSALNPEAGRAYDAALGLVNAHQYDSALTAFATFLVRWPDHPNADNAMYWRGESYYAKGEYARAAEEFEGAVARFPLGNKVPDCLLKLGLCQQKLGNPEKAKSYFDRLSHDFPRSEAARRARGPGVAPGASDKPRSAGPEESP